MKNVFIVERCDCYWLWLRWYSTSKAKGTPWRLFVHRGFSICCTSYIDLSIKLNIEKALTLFKTNRSKGYWWIFSYILWVKKGLFCMRSMKMKDSSKYPSRSNATLNRKNFMFCTQNSCGLNVIQNIQPSWKRVGLVKFAALEVHSLSMGIIYSAS